MTKYRLPEGNSKMPITSFEDLEKQWKIAEQRENALATQLLKKADELGVTITQIHDSLEFGGPLYKVNKLLAWMKEKVESRKETPRD